MIDSPRRDSRTPCVIFGAGGHGRVVLDILLSARRYRPMGFLDSNPALHGRRIDGLPILGGLSALSGLASQGINSIIIAVGDNGVRRGLAEEVDAAGFELINAIHPSAYLAHNVSLGRNVVVAAGALVCAHCQVGDSVILNTGCIIDHETMVGTGAHVCPGARVAGRVTIEAGAFVGIGATVLQCLRIGYDAVVGGGAVVTRDVEPITTVVGVPANTVKVAPNADAFAATTRLPAPERQLVAAET